MKTYLIPALALLVGCTTIHNTNLKEPETVTLSLNDRTAAEGRFSVISEAIVVARLAAGIVLNEFSKEYIGSYSATILSTNGVVLTPKRVLDKQIFFERFVDKQPAAFLTADLVPIPSGGNLGYFQIQPRSLHFERSKAKMTNFLAPLLHANRVNLNVDITLVFPDARISGGLAKYHYAFNVKNLKVGEDRDLTKFVKHSPVFEVPSDGPIIVDVQLTEYNNMNGVLRWMANAVK